MTSSSSSSSPNVSEGRDAQTFVDFELSFLADVVFFRGTGTGALVETQENCLFSHMVKLSSVTEACTGGG